MPRATTRTEKHLVPSHTQPLFGGQTAPVFVGFGHCSHVAGRPDGGLPGRLPVGFL
jgi:hypothetical protein